MGSSRKIANAFFWNTIVNLVNAVYGFIAVPILINHYGKAEYGLIGLAMSINVYMNLMDLGLNSTNVRFFSTWITQKNFLSLKKGFQTSLFFYSVIGFLNAVILFCVAILSKHFFNISPEQNEILKHLIYILMVFAFCNWFSNCFDQLIKATENVAWIQKRTLFTKIVMILVLVVTVYENLSIELYYLLTCLSSLLIVPLSIGKIKREIIQISFLPKWDSESFKKMLPYCLNIFSFGIFQFSYANLRPIFLGIQGTIESVTDYRILSSIVGLVTSFGGTIVGILLPSTAKVVAQHDKDAYYKVAYDGTKYISILICFLCFGMITVSSEVIVLYVGESYLQLLPWLSIWLLCTLSTHNQAISSLILAGTDIKVLSYSSAVASILGLLVCWFLIPSFQIGAVCLSYIAYLAIQLGFFYFYYWPQKMHIQSKKVFLECFSPFVFVGIISCLIVEKIPFEYDCLWLSGFIKGFLFSIIYLCSSFLFISKNDKKFLKKLLLKK